MPRVWFHLIASTYGSWLPGDPRGFRTWHHTEHVEGDYKQPPPSGLYENRHLYAKHLQRHDAIVLSGRFLEAIGVALREQLMAGGGRVLAVAVCTQHAHVQVQLEGGDARLPFGHAKLHAYHLLRDQGWMGKLWAKRSKVIRIRDREHQRNVYRYILDHRLEWAWVWSELEEKRTEGA